MKSLTFISRNEFSAFGEGVKRAGRIFVFVASKQSFLHRVFEADENNAVEWNILLCCNDAQHVGASKQRYSFKSYLHHSFDAVLINFFRYMKSYEVTKLFLWKFPSILSNFWISNQMFQTKVEKTLSYIVKVGHTWKYESTRK